MLYHQLRKRRKPLPVRYIFLLTFVFFIVSTVASLWFINRGIEPTLMAIAEKETRRLANLVVNNAINQQIAEDEFNVENFIKIEKDEHGKISAIDFNTTVVNRVLAKTTNRVQLNLKAASEGKLSALEFPDVQVETEQEQGIIYYIPLGQATNNVLLGNLGPRIPVRFYVIGDVHSDVNKNIRPFGINNALIEIAIHIEVNVQIIIPFATKTATIRNDIPVAIQIIQGEVPQFYNQSGEGNTSIEIPVE